MTLGRRRRYKVLRQYVDGPWFQAVPCVVIILGALFVKFRGIWGPLALVPIVIAFFGLVAPMAVLFYYEVIVQVPKDEEH